MFEREDVVFKDALERVLQRILFGDSEKPGLHQGLRASQSWEMFQRTAGRIEGIELAINEMNALAHRMNDNEPGRDHMSRVN
jgi:hypothetical protein